MDACGLRKLCMAARSTFGGHKLARSVVAAAWLRMAVCKVASTVLANRKNEDADFMDTKSGRA